ncbi:uncharacterized protein KIAA0930 homolog isoform X2 [Corticium candelabrum]|uniref:uncharacterized protein KIAA0930 homolog isoform X2 n=1 Tax=Corticium candelabrum TaxID=121492 RepID=UPI002E258348|nr:uncharacterized protein KIAA0930 homolog isoform X2 [Corticium candelabrum]
MNSPGTCSRLELSHVLQLIRDQRRLKNKLRKDLHTDEFDQVKSDQLRYFASLFGQFYLSGGDNVRDDLLFFVKAPESLSVDDKPNLSKSDGHRLIVLRKDSPQIPSVEDQSINWEETLYLNIVLQQFQYYLSCAIAVKQDGHPLQIERKLSHYVYASPSHQRMDKKGREATLTYPYVFFTVDNFEKVFETMVVREGQSVVVELLAVSHNVQSGCNHSAIVFLGSVKYDVLLKVYKSKMPSSSKVVERMSLGFWKSRDHVHFLRMRGPGGKGHAEIAVSQYQQKQEESGEFEFLGISDNGTRTGTGDDGDRARGLTSDAKDGKSDKEDDSGNGHSAGSDAEASAHLPTTGQKGLWNPFSTAVGWWRSRQASAPSLNSFLTYIQLPWETIY